MDYFDEPTHINATIDQFQKRVGLLNNILGMKPSNYLHNVYTTINTMVEGNQQIPRSTPSLLPSCTIVSSLFQSSRTKSITTIHVTLIS